MSAPPPPGERMAALPPHINDMINRVFKVVEACVGADNRHHQFALLLTTLGAWIETEQDPAPWLKQALETLETHWRVDAERS